MKKVRVGGIPETFSKDRGKRAQASLVAQTVKNLPPMQETRVRSLRREEPMEKGMAIHCSILASLARQTMGSQRGRHD